MAYAYLLSDDTAHLDGAISGIDYILGRNAVDYSYVTGYGSHSIENPHHRYWSYQVDELFPKAPCGVMSGGPNSGMQDPWVQGSGWKKGEIAPQKCYLDHIEAWSVNECTINWNASLAWITAFVAEENGGIEVGSTGTSAGINNDGGNGQSNDKDTYDEDKASENKETADKNSSDKDSSDSKSEEKSEKKSEEKSGSNLGVIALIAGAIIIGLVSIEIFVYKMIKMTKGVGVAPQNTASTQPQQQTATSQAPADTAHTENNNSDNS